MVVVGTRDYWIMDILLRVSLSLYIITVSCIERQGAEQMVHQPVLCCTIDQNRNSNHVVRVKTDMSFLPLMAPHRCHLVSCSQTPPLFDIWTAGRESGALTLKLLFRVLPMTSLVI